MKGQYKMEGPAWSNVTSETKDLIRRLLVVNPKERLTIKEALEHEVFHAQRFIRVGGELLCIITEDEDKETEDEDKEIEEKIEKQESKDKLAISVVAPILSVKKLLSRRKTSCVPVPEAKFQPRKMFRTAIICIRFLIRLKNIKTTPVLLSLEMTRVNPYMMRSYRKSIDMFAFGLYHHWIKKGQGQDRAAVFQNQPKSDAKKKHKSNKSCL